MKLSLNAILLINYVLTFNGDKIKNERGEEVNQARGLNGVESSARHNFTKNIKPILEKHDEKAKEMNAELDKLKMEITEELKPVTVRLEKENDGQFAARVEKLMLADKRVEEKFKEITDKLNEMFKEEHEFETTKKIGDVMKKYYLEYGNKVGFLPADGESVEQINAALGIE